MMPVTEQDQGIEDHRESQRILHYYAQVMYYGETPRQEN